MRPQIDSPCTWAAIVWKGWEGADAPASPQLDRLDETPSPGGLGRRPARAAPVLNPTLGRALRQIHYDTGRVVDDTLAGIGELSGAF
ncbi:hypothetical protein [Aureliella helgolandensis]|uniref:hypothetical protein n=1 Tax=Aureliella helgolandensis TaxID=2527968 RepID=UPI0011A22DD1|nr:hypothetical protein [Aureliella helgolandensis]